MVLKVPFLGVSVFLTFWLILLRGKADGMVQADSSCHVNIFDQLIDLSSLANNNGHPRFSFYYEGWNYGFNPCTPINIPYNPLQGFGDLCHFVLMCRWKEGDDGGFFSLGIQQKQTFVYEPLPLDVYNLLIQQNLNHINRPVYLGEEDDENEQSEEEYGHLDINEDDNEKIENLSQDNSTDSDGGGISSSEERLLAEIQRLKEMNEELRRLDQDYDGGNAAEEGDDNEEISVPSNNVTDTRQKRSTNNETETNNLSTKTGIEFSTPVNPSIMNDSLPVDITNGPTKNKPTSPPTHQIRTETLMLQMRGIKGAKNILTNIILVCDILRTTPESALFEPLVTIEDTLFFTLRYKCCCPDGCRSSLDQESNHISNNDSYISQEHILTVASRAGARHLWLVLLCNAVVLGTAIFIGTVCCGKGNSGGPYNALPGNLHPSRLTIGSNDSHNDNYKDPNRPDRLEYSTEVSRSAQLPKSKSSLIPAIKLELGQRLGGGLYGDTYLGTWRDHKIAAKRITVGTHQKLHEQSIHYFKHIVTHLANQRHKNIVTILGICVEFRQPYVINEFVHAESLKDKISKDDNMDLQVKTKILAQASDGFAFLHSARPPILHRDIRACNILVDSNLRVKVVDFGLITMVQHLRQQCPGVKGCFCDKENSAFPASIRWTSPEILRHPTADEESGVLSTMCDVFSFGMLMWEVLIEADPYEELENEEQVIEIVCSGGRPAVEHLELDWSFAATVNYCNLMKACWLEDITERPSFKQIGVHLKNIQTMSNKKSRIRTDTSTTNYLRSALSIT